MGAQWAFINDEGTPDTERLSCLYRIGGTEKIDPAFDIYCDAAKRAWVDSQEADVEIAAAVVATILNPKHATWEHDTEPIYDFIAALFDEREES